MKKFVNLNMYLKLTIYCLIIFMGALIIYTIIPDTNTYTTETYIVESGDTFWEIYMNNYSDHISYQEALYNFKKDNNMEKYELIERTRSYYQNL